MNYLQAADNVVNKLCLQTDPLINHKHAKYTNSLEAVINYASVGRITSLSLFLNTGQCQHICILNIPVKGKKMPAAVTDFRIRTC